MVRFFGRLVAILAVTFSLVAWGVAAGPASDPMGDSEVLALVAGGALPENIVHEIKSRGLGFRVSDEYRTELKVAGAEPGVLAALDSAKVAAEPGEGKHAELLQHITQAADLMRQQRYPDAVKELNIALAARPGSSEVGFVMGELLRRREKWAEAASVYVEVLNLDPDFPETHTKLAFILYNLGDEDRAIRESKEALVKNAENPEAHKNMGLALEVERNFDAAVNEYREALRLKPDYAPVHYDLGILFVNRRDYASAIVEYQKAIALEPQHHDYHLNLGVAFQRKGDLEGAIREYREAKRLDPASLGARSNLASVLIDRDPDAAVLEFRELVAMAPNFEVCRVCFGRALYKKGDLQGAGEQYRKAVQLEPSDPEAHAGLGMVLEKQQNYDAAMTEYGEALRLDDQSTAGHKGVARLLLQKKDYASAVRELKRAESLDPNQWQVHDLMAQALAATDDTKGAIAEYKEALQIWQKNADLMPRLAALLEEDGDYIGGWQQYCAAAEIQRTDAAKGQCQAAQQRLKAHIDSLRTSGKTGEAAELEGRLASALSAAKSPDAEWQETVDAGMKAFLQRHYGEAEQLMTRAVGVAENLQPRDYRLVRTLGQMGGIYSSQGKFADAATEFRRQLAVTEESMAHNRRRMRIPCHGWGAMHWHNTTTLQR